MKRKFVFWIICCVCLIESMILLAGCSSSGMQEVPVIDADRAWMYTEKNVSFGPRPSGSEALKRSGEWIEECLRQVPGNFEVECSVFEKAAPLGKTLFRNYTVSWPGPGDDFIILGAHYDTKMFFSGADFLGANDGGSGVGVLL